MLAGVGAGAAAAGAVAAAAPLARGARWTTPATREPSLGYITNGLADHRLDDALAFLADCGYDGVALTLDHHHLDPFGRDLPAGRRSLPRLQDLGLAVVIETGARFLLDPRRKHEPTLSRDGRELRIALLRRAIAIAADIGARWSRSGRASVPAGSTPTRRGTGSPRAARGDHEAKAGACARPRTGARHARRAHRRLGAAGRAPRPARGLGLTLDIGHCQCLETEPIDECVRRGARATRQRPDRGHAPWRARAPRFGDGEIDFPPVLAALDEIGYRGLVCVELSRHSHTAHTTVPRAITFLRQAERKEVLA